MEKKMKRKKKNIFKYIDYAPDIQLTKLHI